MAAIIRSYGGLVFDATFEENHTFEREYTENPLETGQPITDNSFQKPFSLTAQVGVSDTPLVRNPNDPFAVGQYKRTQAAFEVLTSLQATGDPFDIQTGLKLYQNMVCLKIKVIQNKDTDSALIFEVDFREAIFVSTQVVSYPRRAIKHSAAKRTKGVQQAKQVDKTEPKGSVLVQLLGLIDDSKKALTSLNKPGAPSVAE